MSYEEQIMSKDTYLSIFSPQVEAVVFIILESLLCATLDVFRFLFLVCVVENADPNHPPFLSH